MHRIFYQPDTKNRAYKKARFFDMRKNTPRYCAAPSGIGT